MRSAHAALVLAWLTPFLTGASEAGAAADWSKEESLLAVVTHTAGIGSAFAHEHLVVAGEVEGELGFDRRAPEGTRFEVSVPVAGLVVDDRTMQERLFPRLRELGAVEEPFAEVSESDRRKIRRSMLADDQLAADGHPTIAARLVSVSSDAGGSGYRAVVELTVRGTPVEGELDARLVEADGELRLEGIGTFDFTDFGIEPYSAMLGAVKVANTFHLYASLVVVREVPTDAPRIGEPGEGR